MIKSHCRFALLDIRGSGSEHYVPPTSSQWWCRGILLGARVEPMHALVLIETASIFVISVCGSWLPWLLALFPNQVMLVLAPIVIMMVVAPMS